MDAPLFSPGDQKVLAPQGDISSASRRADITWLVILWMVALTGIAALCVGHWLAGAILTFTGLVGGAFLFRKLIAERQMVRRMRDREKHKAVP